MLYAPKNWPQLTSEHSWQKSSKNMIQNNATGGRRRRRRILKLRREREKLQFGALKFSLTRRENLPNFKVEFSSQFGLREKTREKRASC